MKGLNPPHLLLASGNTHKMIQNLNHILTAREIAKISAELDVNIVALFGLGLDHFNFASGLDDNNDWRQKISRLYYAVYNFRRAVVLKHNGTYSTDSSDHKSIEQIPHTMLNRESHINNLRNLREDRNLADYSHLGTKSDLVIAPDEALIFATQFFEDCKTYFSENGLVI